MKNNTVVLLVIVSVMLSLCCVNCESSSGNNSSNGGTLPADDAEIIFLHHSTGENIWNGGVADWLAQNASQYQIVERWFPENYGNDPYDYWNLWVNRGDRNELSLETLTSRLNPTTATRKGEGALVIAPNPSTP